jgi:hypothetical protein
MPLAARRGGVDRTPVLARIDAAHDGRRQGVKCLQGRRGALNVGGNDARIGLSVRVWGGCKRASLLLTWVG